MNDSSSGNKMVSGPGPHQGPNGAWNNPGLGPGGKEPAVSPTPPNTPRAPRQSSQESLAKKLVLWSRILGWSGLLIFVLGGPITCIALRTPKAGLIVSGLGLASAFVGGVIGQVGRAMQGRII